MNRSHSRSTTPFDKPLPRADRKRLSPVQAKVVKTVQKRKQRQHDQKLAEQGEEAK